MLLCNTNWFQSFPNRRRWIEEAIPNLDLIVVNDIFMTASAEYADYVLPDCTIYEREDMAVGHGGHIVYLERAIEPMYECRPGIYFWSELARRLGLGEHFQKTIGEWIEVRLNSNHPSITGIQPPITLERLKQEKIIRANVPTRPLQPLLDKKFPTPSGRIELYNEEFVEDGDALPVFREQLESPRSSLAKRYPLVFNTANNIFFVHTAFANDPLIQKSYLKEPHLSINPTDAGERKIFDGDTVTAYNDRGSCTLKALVTDAVPPGVVHVPHGWWPRQFIEGHLQDLIPSVASTETADRAREIHWDLSERKLGHLNVPEQFFAYSPDTINDCLCEVKRYEKK
jgi:molybdopterin-containing oxidoreductase family molybdopterin binding subunit